MKRLRLTTAAALASFGLLCGCATNTNTCGERQGFFSRWFGGNNRSTPCECVETGRITVSDGPVVPEPSVGEPSYPGPSVGEPSYPISPILPTPAPVMPNAGPLAQPIPAGPASQVKDVK